MRAPLFCCSSISVALGTFLFLLGGPALAQSPPSALQSATPSTTVRATSFATQSAPPSPPPIILQAAGQTLSFRIVPAAVFDQGSPPTEAGRGADETPRRVRLMDAFAIQTTPVTRGQFAAFVAATGYKTEVEQGAPGFGLVGPAFVQDPKFNWRNPGFVQTDEHPVVGLTFDDAEAFVKWAAEVTKTPGLGLPTEAQYEWAARGAPSSAVPLRGAPAVATSPTPTTSPTGSATPSATASPTPTTSPTGSATPARPDGWFNDAQPQGTRPVGLKPANGYGLFDMAGNVYVWCRDAYAPYPARDLAFNPLAEAPPAGEPLRRVLRGGSFFTDALRGRPAARWSEALGRGNPDTGMRLVMPLPSTLAAASAPASSRPSPRQAPDEGRISPPPPNPRSPFLPILFLVGPVLGLGAIVFAVRRSAKRASGSESPPPSGTPPTDLPPAA